MLVIWRLQGSPEIWSYGERMQDSPVLGWRGGESYFPRHVL